VSVVTLNRPGVPADEVRQALVESLPSRYKVEVARSSRGFVKSVPADANSLLVTGAWLARANVRVISAPTGTEIQISPGATFPGLVRLADRVGIARTVHHALKRSDQFGSSG
jgi:hypothetical protein